MSIVTTTAKMITPSIYESILMNKMRRITPPVATSASAYAVGMNPSWYPPLSASDPIPSS